MSRPGTNGYNVYPREVEEILNQNPQVVSVAVFGVPHEVHGEEVAAAIVLAPASTVTPEELTEYARARLASYKYPRIITLMQELPVGPSGKILKRKLTAQYVANPSSGMSVSEKTVK